MPRTTATDRDLKRVLEFVLNRDVLDIEVAAAVGKPNSTFARRKNHRDFPTYEELARVGEYFDVSAKALQIAFGLRGVDELVLLDEEELRQFEWIQGPPTPPRSKRRPRPEAPNL